MSHYDDQGSSTDEDDGDDIVAECIATGTRNPDTPLVSFRKFDFNEMTTTATTTLIARRSSTPPPPPPSETEPPSPPSETEPPPEINLLGKRKPVLEIKPPRKKELPSMEIRKKSWSPTTPLTPTTGRLLTASSSKTPPSASGRMRTKSLAIFQKKEIKPITQQEINNFVKDGILQKQGGYNRGWKTRYFVLSQNKLIWYANKADNNNPKGWIALNSQSSVQHNSPTVRRKGTRSATFEGLNRKSQESSSGYLFQVSGTDSSGAQRTMFLKAEIKNEEIEWKKALESVIANCNTNNTSTITAATVIETIDIETTLETTLGTTIETITNTERVKLLPIKGETKISEFLGYIDLSEKNQSVKVEPCGEMFSNEYFEVVKDILDDDKWKNLRIPSKSKNLINKYLTMIQEQINREKNPLLYETEDDRIQDFVKENNKNGLSQDIVEKMKKELDESFDLLHKWIKHTEFLVDTAYTLSIKICKFFTNGEPDTAKATSTWQDTACEIKKKKYKRAVAQVQKLQSQYDKWITQLNEWEQDMVKRTAIITNFKNSARKLHLLLMQQENNKLGDGSLGQVSDVDLGQLPQFRARYFQEKVKFNENVQQIFETAKTIKKDHTKTMKDIFLIVLSIQKDLFNSYNDEIIPDLCKKESRQQLVTQPSLRDLIITGEEEKGENTPAQMGAFARSFRNGILNRNRRIKTNESERMMSPRTQLRQYRPSLVLEKMTSRRSSEYLGIWDAAVHGDLTKSIKCMTVSQLRDFLPVIGATLSVIPRPETIEIINQKAKENRCLQQSLRFLEDCGLTISSFTEQFTIDINPESRTFFYELLPQELETIEKGKYYKVPNKIEVYHPFEPNRRIIAIRLKKIFMSNAKPMLLEIFAEENKETSTSEDMINNKRSSELMDALNTLEMEYDQLYKEWKHASDNQDFVTAGQIHTELQKKKV